MVGDGRGSARTYIAAGSFGSPLRRVPLEVLGIVGNVGNAVLVYMMCTMLPVEVLWKSKILSCFRSVAYLPGGSMYVTIINQVW